MKNIIIIGILVGCAWFGYNSMMGTYPMQKEFLTLANAEVMMPEPVQRHGRRSSAQASVEALESRPDNGLRFMVMIAEFAEGTVQEGELEQVSKFFGKLNQAPLDTSESQDITVQGRSGKQFTFGANGEVVTMQVVVDGDLGVFLFAKHKDDNKSKNTANNFFSSLTFLD